MTRKRQLRGHLLNVLSVFSDKQSDILFFKVAVNFKVEDVQ